MLGALQKAVPNLARLVCVQMDLQKVATKEARD